MEAPGTSPAPAAGLFAVSTQTLGVLGLLHAKAALQAEAKIAERNFRELAIFRPIKSFTQEKSPSLARPAANVTLKKGPEKTYLK